MMQGERLETFMLYKINSQPKSLQNRIYAKVTLPKIQVLIWTRLFINYIKELIRILLEELIDYFVYKKYHENSSKYYCLKLPCKKLKKKVRSPLFFVLFLFIYIFFDKIACGFVFKFLQKEINRTFLI